MPRVHASFRQADIKRAVSGAEAAGMEVTRVEVDLNTGRITLLARNANPEPINELDSWLSRNHGASN